jgi:Ca-activated chloride channel family protein
MMFEFAWPWMIVLLPLPWLVRRYLAPSPRALERAGRGEPPQLRHPGVARLESAYSRVGVTVPPSLLWQFLLLWVAWFGLVGSMMKPQLLESHTEVVSSGYDLMLAVDTSRSMEALDFSVDGKPVNRLAVVKGVVGRFIEQRRGDRIGLVLFGDSAFLQAPLTTDGAAVSTMLETAVPRMAGDSTAIGDAVGLGVKKLRERPTGSRVLILLTDGENTSGSLPPREAAMLARRYDTRLYTIGVGSDDEVPFPQPDGRIKMEEMPLDEDLLREMADMTGGAYFRATDSRALEEIYREIDTLEKSEAESRSVLIPSPLYRWPLGVALAAMLLLALNFMRTGRPVRFSGGGAA